MTMRIPFRHLALCALLAFPAPAGAEPIHEAAIAGDIAEIGRLLDGGADVDAPDPMGTPLQWALFGNQTDAARFLIERGADANVAGVLGSPVQAAVRLGERALVALLLARGADPNRGEGVPALAIAAQNSDVDTVNLLLGHGADPSAVSHEGMTALHEAARAGNLRIVRALVEHGADVNALAALGKPPIHFAMERNHGDVAAYLKDQGWAPRPVASITHLLASADLAKGEAEAQACAVCHLLTDGWDDFAPSLWNVVGRDRGSVAGYRYSSAFAALDGVWTFEALNRFLAQPREAVPGTKMELAGIEEPQKRADVIAYLRTLSDNPVPLP